MKHGVPCSTARCSENSTSAAVIGLPDEILGQSILAFVVHGSHPAPTSDALLENVAALLPRHMVPRDVVVLDELPKTPSGKIDYPSLRKRHADTTAGADQPAQAPLNS